MGRKKWIALMDKIYSPVFKNFSQDSFKQNFITDDSTPQERREAQYLEAFGRSFLSISRWLSINHTDADEEELKNTYTAWVMKSLENVTGEGKDRLDFCGTPQALVDAAFLAQGLLRSYDVIYSNLEEEVRKKLLSCLKSSRKIKPYFNNWLLFSAMVEAFLYKSEGKCDLMRIDYALRQHEQWYKGDGIYGDGPGFHFDYYNSFVIYPMMLEILDVAEEIDPEWKNLKIKVLERAKRYATVQERLISPEGTFPPLGRSLAYRMGAFHHLAHMAYRHELEPELSLGQVREALWAITERIMKNPGNFDSSGWLNIGFTSRQPSIGEVYINKGSLYLCGTVFEVLGRGEEDLFWTSPAQPWTSKRLWTEYEDIPADKSMK